MNQIKNFQTSQYRVALHEKCIRTYFSCFESLLFYSWYDDSNKLFLIHCLVILSLSIAGNLVALHFLVFTLYYSFTLTFILSFNFMAMIVKTLCFISHF